MAEAGAGDAGGCGFQTGLKAVTGGEQARRMTVYYIGKEANMAMAERKESFEQRFERLRPFKVLPDNIEILQYSWSFEDGTEWRDAFRYFIGAEHTYGEDNGEPDEDDFEIRYTLGTLAIFDEADDNSKKNPKSIFYFREMPRAARYAEVNECIKQYSKPAVQYSLYVLSKREMRRGDMFWEGWAWTDREIGKKVAEIETIPAIDEEPAQNGFGVFQLPIWEAQA